ncbi:hypothetical protein O6H91_07G061700 [Diphasiastrum complanatum]|uniref:Uncharacterized protein n=2 Tax=Diphasiastrum complanatum TaxID=34168 RepID=A0ACC2D682_DIPCM|nr:hypothetical protein O6H91_07G061700 [Diphasiastrum complanatum]KAJ7549669.1 hypothetical protein O6H91_07G061700 [Diphasiastrum complanatum]
MVCMGDIELWPQPSGLLPAAIPSSADAFTSSLRNENWAQAEARVADIIIRIQPNQASEEQRKSVVQYVQRLISRCFDCKVFAFGSVPLKTYLPGGDIDLTTFSQQYFKDTWVTTVRSVLEEEERRQDAQFRVKEVHYIHAEVKIIKCLVESIVVDISFNQLGGLCTLCFLEEVDQLIGQNHLFKRSIILVKAWCYYESRILGAHHGLISTYALETLVLYIFHVFHASLRGPLEVLFRFLDFYSKFDWDNYCVSLLGPVPLSSLPYMAVQPPRRDGGELLLGNEFLISCSQAYASVPYDQEGQVHQTFTSKFMNVIDPLRVTNNLGRSVSKGNFFRIHSAFSYGARKLASILCHSKVDVIGELECFFKNTLRRHGSGRRPNAPDPIDQLCQHLSAGSVSFDTEDGSTNEGEKHTNDHLGKVDDVRLVSDLVDTKCEISTIDGTLLASSPYEPDSQDAITTAATHGKAPAVVSSTLMTATNFVCERNCAKSTDVKEHNVVNTESLMGVTSDNIILARDAKTNLSSIIDDANRDQRRGVGGSSRTLADSLSSFNGNVTSTNTIPNDFVAPMVRGEVGGLTTVRNDNARDIAHRGAKANNAVQIFVETSGGERDSCLPVADINLLPEKSMVESLSKKTVFKNPGSTVEALASEGLRKSCEPHAAAVDHSNVLNISSSVGHSNHLLSSLPREDTNFASPIIPVSGSSSGPSPTSVQFTHEGIVDPHLSSLSVAQGHSNKFQRQTPKIIEKGERFQHTWGPVQIPDASHGNAPFLYGSAPYQLPLYVPPDPNGATLGSNHSVDLHFRDRSSGEASDNVETNLSFNPNLSSRAPIPLGVVEILKHFGIKASRSSVLQDSGSSSTLKEGQAQDSRFDSLCGDFAYHLNCLVYGRYCQYLSLSAPMWMDPSFISPPWYLQGRHPWEGPGRPLQPGIDVFGNVYSPRSSFYPPVSTAMRSPGRGKYRANAPNAFGQEEPRRPHGNRYFPNSRNGVFRERQFPVDGRGHHLIHNQDHNGGLDRDGTHVFTPRHKQSSYELKGDDFPPLTPDNLRGSNSRTGSTATGRAE